MNKIFFLIPLLLFSSIGFQQVFATEISISPTTDETGYWEEATGFQGAQCGTGIPISVNSTDADTTKIDNTGVGFGTTCRSGFMGFNLTSIPPSEIITNVELVFDRVVTGGGESTGHCYVSWNATKPSVMNATEMWGYLWGTGQPDRFGTDVWRTPYSDMPDCYENLTTGDYSITLDSAVDTIIENAVGTTDWITFILDRDGDYLDVFGVDNSVFEFNNVMLNVTYATAPDTPKQFFGNGIDWQGVDMNWVQGDVTDDAHLEYEMDYWSGTTWISVTTIPSDTFYVMEDFTVPNTNDLSVRIKDNGVTNTNGCYNYLMNSTLSTNLIFHHNLCGNVRDSGLLDNDGTVTGTETYIDYNNEKWMQFHNSTSGVTEYVDFGSVSEYDFDIDEEFSWAYWYYKDPTNLDINDDGEHMGSVSTQGWRSQTDFGGEAEIFYRTTGGQLNFITGDTVIPLGTPTHIAGTYDGSSNADGFTLYVNGTSEATGGFNALVGTFDGGGVLRISNPNIGGKYIKDAMVFNSTLTDHQVFQIYNRTIDADFKPWALQNLEAQVIDGDTVGLTIVQPLHEWTPTTCFQINYTTPLGDPLTVVEPCVAGANDFAVNGLDTFNNNYTFGINVINQNGRNDTSPIANITSFPTFEIGDIYVPIGDNPVTFPIEFEEIIINDDQSVLQVVYSNAADLACDFDYKFARTNQTYTGLTETSIGGGKVYTNFTLNDPNNEIITVYCWDVLDNSTDGTYLITQATMPLLAQVQGFQGGLYGTDGKFGVLDLMTLFVVLISMIGFNRYNPALGVIVMVMAMGALSWFGFIQWESTLMGVIALIVVLAVIQVRKT